MSLPSATPPLCNNAPSSAANWLSLEGAAKETSVSIETLQICLEATSPEKCFQPHGLLFDRERRQAGHSEFLQLLEQPASLTNHFIDRSTVSDDRSYQWDTALIRIELCWQPLTPNADERQILITATSYDDFPMCELITESALGVLPSVLINLLEELRSDLSVRQIRYQKQAAKGKGKASSTHADSRSTSSSATVNPPVNQTVQPIQTSLL
jgi:hypothetical protein